MEKICSSCLCFTSKFVLSSSFTFHLFKKKKKKIQNLSFLHQKSAVHCHKFTDLPFRRTFSRGMFMSRWNHQNAASYFIPPSIISFHLNVNHFEIFDRRTTQRIIFLIFIDLKVKYLSLTINYYTQLIRDTLK